MMGGSMSLRPAGHYFLLSVVFLSGQIDASLDQDTVGIEARILPTSVLTMVNQAANFTITMENITLTNYTKICWMSTGEYVYPLDNTFIREKNELRWCLPLVEGETLVNFTTQLIGVFKLRLYLIDETGHAYFLHQESEAELVVRRDQQKRNDIITLVFSVVIGVALALMGLDIDIKIVAQTMKRPVGPLVGFLAQFLIMPTGSYLLGWLFLETSYERLGLLLLGCSPGGAKSNFWTAMFNGDVNLSVTMTFLSSCASFAFTPVWIYLLGTPMVEKSIPIPYMRLVISLVSFTFPLLIGVLIKHMLPRVGDVLRRRVSRPFFLTCLICLPAVGIYNNIHFFYLCTWRHVVAGVLLGCIGYVCGALLALVFRMGRPQIIAISLETAIQNGGIAFIVLSLTFPSPYSDMGLLPVFSFIFLSTGPIMIVAYGVYRMVQGLLSESKPVFSQVAQTEAEATRLS